MINNKDASTFSISEIDFTYSWAETQEAATDLIEMDLNNAEHPHFHLVKKVRDFLSTLDLPLSYEVIILHALVSSIEDGILQLSQDSPLPEITIR